MAQTWSVKDGGRLCECGHMKCEHADGGKYCSKCLYWSALTGRKGGFKGCGQFRDRAEKAAA
jgi:hypothetical protein